MPNPQGYGGSDTLPPIDYTPGPLASRSGEPPGAADAFACSFDSREFDDNGLSLWERSDPDGCSSLPLWRSARRVRPLQLLRTKLRNRIASRMDERSPSSMTSRSTPRP